jgi:hypothetical protein
MILSASRRTDIPAFFFDWFLNRLKIGYVLVRNPFNSRQVSRISLQGTVDCVVFWTKNPACAFRRLEELTEYEIPYYFLFTITPYGPQLERNLPPEDERIDTFRKLADALGKERVIWRYDPILFSSSIDVDFHRRHFARIAKKLEGTTDRCVISFLDLYKKCRRNLAHFHIIDATEELMLRTGTYIGEIARGYGISLQSCAEEMDLSIAGITKGKCIDDSLVSKLVGEKITLPKDASQRKACGCVESIDIGVYNSCAHGCQYCYANFNHDLAQRNCALHDPSSPLLIGTLQRGDRVVERELRRFTGVQQKLFPF